MNATHQVGCQSELGGNLGVVWLVETTSDLEHVLKAGPTPPYIAILRKRHYSKKNLLKFKANTDRISGVVFLDDGHDDSASRADPFSPDDICPNRYSGLYVNDSMYGDCRHPWQDESPVSGLLYEDIPFPIFLINDKKSIENIEACFNANNVIADNQSRQQASYPLCGIQLDSFMLAAKDSAFCLNSRFVIDEILQSNQRRCDTIDNSNLFAYYKLAKGPLHPNGNQTYRPDVTEPQSLVMLVTKLSSLSMFSEISPGADSTITSIITLLAVAEALSRVRNSTAVTSSKRNILFAVLDSEPYDYTGSSRFASDMSNNTFPHGIVRGDHLSETEVIQNSNLLSIDYLINLDQMASYPGLDSIHFHSDPHEPSSYKLDKLYNVMQQTAAKHKLKLEREIGSPLPPTSAHEFIKHSRQALPPGNQLTGIVLSNYNSTYRNKLYHSIYDDSHNIYQTSKIKQVQHLTQVSQFLAQSLYKITFQATNEDISVNPELIEQLLDCYLIDAQCHLFTRACQAGQKLPSGPVQTYKDPIKRSDDINGIITSNLLAYFLGDKMPGYNHTKCIEENIESWVYDFRYLNDKDEPVEDGSSGTCIRSQSLTRTSYSLAYYLTDEGEYVIDTRYPAWTVSSNGIRTPVRLYLIPNPLSEWSLFMLGLVVTITSFAIVKALRTRLKCLNVLDEQVATST